MVVFESKSSLFWIDGSNSQLLWQILAKRRQRPKVRATPRESHHIMRDGHVGLMAGFRTRIRISILVGQPEPMAPGRRVMEGAW